MIKVEVNRDNTTLFGELVAGDTFIGADNKCYIKIPTVTRVKNFEYFGTYTAVCITNGGLAYIVEEQPVTVVEITAEVLL